VLDPSLRSSTPVTKTFDAYTGSVTCIDVKNYTCVTLGANLSRHGAAGGSIDPRTGRFSTNPRQVPDSAVKVFDLRTNRQLPPAQFMGGGGPGGGSGGGKGGGGGGGAPTFLSFLPSFSSTILAASPNGALRMIEARGTDPTQFFQVFMYAFVLCGWLRCRCHPLSLNIFFLLLPSCRMYNYCLSDSPLLPFIFLI